ncbi:uncharacterized protein LOC131942805 isoform X2 [Physella acuta]|nr:uncharacterized protein LOC131942805 isoform X2 [Physella acuta]
MTPTTDLKSPHEEVVTITESVESDNKNPTKIAKLSFVFFVASVIINWYYLVVESNFYKQYKQLPSSDESIDGTIFIFLSHNIAYGVICLHIFTNRCIVSKVTTVIAPGVCIFTSIFLFATLNLMSTKENQTMTLEDYVIYYILGIAPHYVQFITGLRMVIEMYNIT